MTEPNRQSQLTNEQINSVLSLYSNGQYQDAINQIKVLNKNHPNVPFLFNLVGACYKALGQIESSVQMFEMAVKIKPDYAEALKNLGITLRSLGQMDKAVANLKKAISADSHYIDAHYNLAITLKDMGNLNDSVESYQKAIDLNPNFAHAHNNLGNVFKDLDRIDDAIISYKKALEIDPNFANAHNNLGNAFKDLDLTEDAVKSYKRAIEIQPNFAEAHNNVGNVFKDSRSSDNAIKCYKKAIEINENFAEAYYNLGVMLRQIKNLDLAVKNLQRAISIKPNYAEAFNNLGSCYTMLGEINSAIDCYEKAIFIKPDYAEAHNSLGNIFNILGKIKTAIKYFEKAIEINPSLAEAYNSLGNAFKKMKQRDNSLVYFEKAFSLKPNIDYILGDILNSKMHLCDWNNFQKMTDEITMKIVKNEKAIDSFNLMGLIDDPALQMMSTSIRINSDYPRNNTLPQINLYPKHPKIRIGYFSADFREHPVGFLTAELYELHDRDHFEIHAFSYGLETNGLINLRIKAGVDHFHNVDLMSHQQIVELVRSLEIDIAVDLGGITSEARTEVFAMSVAPIQLSYIGYLGTMGADYYDYLIADPVMIPKESQQHYVEKIVYLPSFQVNDSKDLPPDITLTRNDVGLPQEGFVFCCFNNTYKFTPTIFDSWARILQKVDGSVLIVYASNEVSKSNLTKEIERRGIDSERLVFGDSLDRPEYLARYRVTDLFLDTHPYNAGTTASDALKMGLPIITILGKSFNSREAASILTSINLPELITSSLEEYEALAIDLATNPKKLKAIKDKLAANLSTAPLYDTPLFTKNLETAYTKMYERYHDGLEPDHIYFEHFK
jgi:predicted O-linked N-acetylglucosamine transferase (SPINDLY family)